MKNLTVISSLLALTLFQGACKEQPKFKILPSGPIMHQLIVAAKTNRGVRAQGFQGAAPVGTKIFFESGAQHLGPITTKDGSFLIELFDTDKEATHGEFTFTLPEGQQLQVVYRLKDLSEALPMVAKEALTTPPEVDHVCINKDEALILSTEAALLRRIDITPGWSLTDSARASILLNPTAANLLSPRAIASRAKHAVVTMFDSHELALIDLSDNKLLPKLLIKNPQSHSAEQIMALDDKTYVASFVNFNKDTQAIDAPGAVALLRVTDNELKSLQVLSLPYKNPQFFKMHNQKELWISCTGAFSSFEGGDLETHDAGLVKLVIADDLQGFKPGLQKIPFVKFTPGAFEIVGKNIVVPELWGNRIAVLKHDATELKAEDYKTPTYHRPFNFTLASHWHDNIVFIGDATGTLVAYSLSKDGEPEDKGFFPFPFIGPLKLDKNQDSQIKFVPHQLIFRHQATNTPLTKDYPTGFNAWVVSQVQSRIIPLDFLEIFGP